MLKLATNLREVLGTTWAVAESGVAGEQLCLTEERDYAERVFKVLHAPTSTGQRSRARATARLQSSVVRPAARQRQSTSPSKDSTGRVTWWLLLRQVLQLCSRR